MQQRRNAANQLKAQKRRSMKTQMATSYLFIVFVYLPVEALNWLCTASRTTRMHNLAFVRDQRFANDFVFAIDVQRAFF
jgi:hypothetical protein